MIRKYRKDLPSTINQRDLIEKLGLGEVITADMSSEEVSRIIRNTLSDVQRVREDAERVQETKRNREDLELLLENGLCVGSVVYYKDSHYPRTVKKIDLEQGLVSCVSGKNYVLSIAPRFIRMDDTAKAFPGNLDEWHPVGYQEVPPSVFKRILAGELGNKVAGMVKVRDSFLENKRRAYLPIKMLQEVEQIVIQKGEEKRVRKEKVQQGYEAKMDIRFCMQCGTRIVRPSHVSREGWSKVRRYM